MVAGKSDGIHMLNKLSNKFEKQICDITFNCVISFLCGVIDINVFENFHHIVYSDIL